MKQPIRLKIAAAKLKERSFEAIRLKALDVCLEAAEGVITKTPVDTGFARSMWGVQINDRPMMDPVANSIPKGEDGPGIAGGAAALASVTVEAAKLRLGDTVWIYNPTEYAPYLENGSSSQAPNGMVAVTVQELRVRYG